MLLSLSLSLSTYLFICSYTYIASLHLYTGGVSNIFLSNVFSVLFTANTCQNSILYSNICRSDHLKLITSLIIRDWNEGMREWNEESFTFLCWGFMNPPSLWRASQIKGRVFKKHVSSAQNTAYLLYVGGLYDPVTIGIMINHDE